MKSYLWLVFILSPAVVFAQSARVDEIYKLKAQLKSGNSVSTQTKLYCELGHKYFQFDIDSCEFYSRKALQNVKKMPLDYQGEIYELYAEMLSLRYGPDIQLYLDSARNAFEQSDRMQRVVDVIAKMCAVQSDQHGIDYYLSLARQGEQTSRKIGYDAGLAYMLYIEGMLQLKRNNNEEAAEALFKESMEVHLKIQHKNPSALISEMGNLYYRDGRYATALETYAKAIPYLKASDDIYGFSYIYTHMALAQAGEGQLDMALQFIDLSIQYREQAKDIGGLLFSNLERGILLLDRGELNRAEKAKVLIDSLNKEGKYFTDIIALFVGKLLMTQGEYDQAIQFLNKEISKLESGNDLSAYRLNFTLAQLYYRVKDDKNFNLVIEQCFVLADKLHNQVFKVQLNLLIAQYNIEEDILEPTLRNLENLLGSFDYHQSPVVAAQLLGWTMIINKRLARYDRAFDLLNELKNILKKEEKYSKHTQLSKIVGDFEAMFLKDELRLSVANKQKRLYLITTLAALLLVSSSFVLLLFRKNHLDKKLLAETRENMRLISVNEKLTKLKFEEFRSQSEEEKRELFVSLDEKEDQLEQLNTDIQKAESSLIQKEERLNHLLSMQMQKTELTRQVYDEINALKRHNGDISELSREIKEKLDAGNGWHNFSVHFENVYPEFFTKLRSNFPMLTSNEQRISAFIKMGLKNKEIAAINGVSSRAVEKARERMKKKMEVEDLRNTILEI